MDQVVFVKYELQTGRIICVGHCPYYLFDTQYDPVNGEWAIIDTANDVTDYVDITTDTIKQKPPMPTSINKTVIAADGLDTAIITGIPAGAEAVIRGPAAWSGTIDDGQLDVTADAAGQYVISLVLFPYLDQEYIVNAS